MELMSGIWYQPTADRQVNVFVSALAAIENKHNSFRWGGPPRLCVLIANPGNETSLRVREIPGQPQGPGPFTAVLAAYAKATAAGRAPDLAGRQRLAYIGRPPRVVGVMVMSDGRAANPDTLGEHEWQLLTAGEQVLGPHNSYQVRYVSAVDVNGVSAYLRRRRGDETAHLAAVQDAHGANLIIGEWSPTFILDDVVGTALATLAMCARDGIWPDPKLWNPPGRNDRLN